ncbi:MAG: major tail protein [Anaerotignaceae bacterium]
MANKVKFGLKSVHYAVITVGEDGSFTYAAPVAIPGAVNLSLSPLGDKGEFFADDGLYFNTTPNLGYEGNLEVALVTDGFKKDVLGYKEDANGVLFEDAEALPKDFALMFEFKGDKNSVRHALYKVSAARPNIESGTKTASVEVKTETFDITASPDPSGMVKAKAEPENAGYDTWYTTVYKHVEATMSPTTVTFSLASPADVTATLTPTTATIASVKNVSTALTLDTDYTYSTGTLTIKSTYLSTQSAGSTVLTVTTGGGTVLTLTITVTA